MEIEQTEEYKSMEMRFGEAWNEGARPDDIKNLYFLDEYDRESVQYLYKDLLLNEWALISQRATLEEYLKTRSITLPTLWEKQSAADSWGESNLPEY